MNGMVYQRPSKREEGAALIILVLVLVVVLAGVVLVSASLAVNARQNTSDQRAALQSQYTAESGASQAKAQLATLYTLMANVKLAPAVSRETLVNQFSAICGTQATQAAAVMPASPSTATVILTDAATSKNYSVVRGDGQLINSTLMCDLTTVTPSGAAVANLFNTYTPATILNSLALGGDKTTTFVTSVMQPATLSNGLLLPAPLNRGQLPSSLGNVNTQFALVPISVSREGLDRFSFNFLISDLNSIGVTSAADAKRAISAAAFAFSTRKLYSLTISKAPFSKYSLFTNHHFSSASDESNSNNIWFTSSTNFSGPVHTNQTFNFKDNPNFDGKITSAGCPAGYISSDEQSCTGVAVPGARFYSYSPSTIVPPSAMSNPQNPSYYNDAPTVTGGVDWNHDFVPLPNNGQDQRNDAQSSGLLISSNLNSGASNSTVFNVSKMSFGITPATQTTPEYQTISYTKYDGNGLSTAVQLRYAADNLMQIFNTSTNSWVQAYKNTSTGEWGASASSGITSFNGVIFADGRVDSVFSATTTAIAQFSKITLSANRNIVISDNLRYEDPPVACTGSLANSTCGATNATKKNVLGIYSSLGDVQIANTGSNTKNTNPGTCNLSGCSSNVNAPNNVTINAVLMSSKGAVRVQNNTQGSNRGSVNLLGGIIEDYYGAFGTTAGAGFGRSYTYDSRMDVGFSPPSFPTQKNWDTGIVQGSIDGSVQPTDATGLFLTNAIGQAKP